VAYDDIVDSEDSDSDNNSTHGKNKTEPVGYRKLLSNSKLSSKRHCTTNVKYSSNLQDSWHDESNASPYTKRNPEDIHNNDSDNTSIDADVDGTHNHLFLNSESDGEYFEDNGGNEDDEDVDADIDGTHNHLFLNSESEGEDDEGNGRNEDDKDAADDEGYKIKRRAQKAASEKKSYWNKKQQVDVVKTSYAHTTILIR
jgi:hypothetical protein